MSRRFLAILECLKHLTPRCNLAGLLYKLDDSSRFSKFADYLFRYVICFDTFDTQRESKIPSEHLAVYVSYNQFPQWLRCLPSELHLLSSQRVVYCNKVTFVGKSLFPKINRCLGLLLKQGVSLSL